MFDGYALSPAITSQRYTASTVEQPLGLMLDAKLVRMAGAQLSIYKKPGLHKSGRGQGLSSSASKFWKISYLASGDQVVVELSYL
jgi:hypothetical protein